MHVLATCRKQRLWLIFTSLSRLKAYKQIQLIKIDRSLATVTIKHICYIGNAFNEAKRKYACQLFLAYSN